MTIVKLQLNFIRTLAVKDIEYHRLHVKRQQMFVVENDRAVFGFRKIILHHNLGWFG